MLTFDVMKKHNFQDYDLEELFEVLLELDDWYANEPEKIDDYDVKDSDYDALYRFCKMADPSNEYFTGVGSEVRGGKVALPYKMGSLNQLYNDADLQRWLTSYKLLNEDLIISAKYDGNATETLFGPNGDLRISYSRGNGLEGADTTRHMKTVVTNKHSPSAANVANLIKFLNVSGTLALRCEVICPKSAFPAVKSCRGEGKDYKNPRNMVAGLMNKSDPITAVLKELHVVPFNIDNLSAQLDKNVQLEALADAGFQPVLYKVVKGKDLTADLLLATIREFKSKVDYELDGVVVEVNCHKARMKIQPKNDALNPEYAIKFKEATMIARPTVKHVEWNISKHGYAKPTVVYESVELGGVTCNRATAFNAGFIRDHKIGPGTVLEIVRSGDVIPYITQVITPTKADMPKEEEFGPMVWSENDRGENVDLILVNLPKEARIQQLVAFADTLRVAHLGEGNVRAAFDAGFETPADFIKMSEDHWKYAVGDSIGSKIYASFQKALHDVDDYRLAASIGVFGRGVGVRKLKKVVAALKCKVTDINKIKLLDVESVKDKTADKIVRGIPLYKEFLKEVGGYVKVKTYEEVTGGKFSGLSLVFTGFRNADLEAYIEKRGGEMKTSVSAKTSIVVAVDVNEDSGKLKKAREINAKAGKEVVQIMSLEDFKEKFGLKGL